MTIFGDYETSVKKALTEIDPRWHEYPGLIICGSHTPLDHDVEGMIEKIKNARLFKLPFLGICFGHQLAAIEHCRNVWMMKNATSEEFGKGLFVVKKRTEGLNVGEKNGESYWNNYEVDPKLERLWQKPVNFFTSQFHPEYQSSITNPHPLLVDFLKYAKRQIK